MSPEDNAPHLPAVRILGSKVHKVETEDVVDILEAWIRERSLQCRHVICTGFHGLWVAHKDPEYRRIVESCDLFAPDGIAPVWLSRLYGSRLRARAPGPDIMTAFFRRANERGYRSFFLGDTSDTLDALRRRLQRDYPGHVVAGVHSPPFRELSDREKRLVVNEINDSKADILWVGLGLPKQDFWIAEHRARLRVAAAVGVGAAFRFHSGRVSRAPELVGAAGFEWLWRLAHEPKKLWRRDLVDGPQFLLAVLRDLLEHHRRSPRSRARE